MHVYIITNKVNNKVYVGQHVGENLEKYLRHNIRHALNNSGNKTYLYRAIRKYGGDVFSIRSLVYCNDKPQMDTLEKVWIAECDSRDPNIGYNITAGGGGRLGIHRLHTEEEKRKIGDAHRGRPHSEEHCKNLSLSQIGRKFSEEHKAALRAGQIGKSKYRSPEHCNKISELKRQWWAKKKLEAVDGTS